MYTIRFQPPRLAPEELDAFLGRGWYRMGQAIFTCRFVIFDRVLRSAIWIRLPLDGYRFRPGLRRRLDRVGRRFRTAIGPARVDETKERLYQSYRAQFRGTLAPTLEAAFSDGDAGNVFDSRELTVHDGDRLVAFSFFDIGRSALASIIGVYDPEFARASLGFYTMLREVEFALASDMTYFYPGYIVPGYPAMDYKLRVGDVEYYDLEESRWRPYSELASRELPSDRMARSLEEARVILHRSGLPSRVRLYPHYELSALGGWLGSCLSQPLFLALAVGGPSTAGLVVTYDLDRSVYLVDRYEPIHVVPEPVPGVEYDVPAGGLQLLKLRRRLAEVDSGDGLPAAVVEAIGREGGGRVHGGGG